MLGALEALHSIVGRAQNWLRHSFVLAIGLALLIREILITLPTAAAHQMASCSAGSASPRLIAATDMFTLTGRVRDPTGIAVACVEVFAFSGAFLAAALTDSTGQF